MQSQWSLAHAKSCDDLKSTTTRRQLGIWILPTVSSDRVNSLHDTLVAGIAVPWAEQGGAGNRFHRIRAVHGSQKVYLYVLLTSDAHCCHMDTDTSLRHLLFLTSGHSDAQPWASECPEVKNYKWRLNPVWHRMLYSCTHMAPVGVKRLIYIMSVRHSHWL